MIRNGYKIEDVQINTELQSIQSNVDKKFRSKK